mmetsp:Transcript_121595/g.315603  ORF Transcript_121595/g.315603 Transcript_121595/m.315603 type:complete len:391 (-) Transcript_121595:197-1369(-)
MPALAVPGARATHALPAVDVSRLRLRLQHAASPARLGPAAFGYLRTSCRSTSSTPSATPAAATAAAAAIAGVLFGLGGLAGGRRRGRVCCFGGQALLSVPTPRHPRQGRLHGRGLRVARHFVSNANVEDLKRSSLGAVATGSVAVMEEGNNEATRMRFAAPKQVPTTWWQLAHHVLVASVILGTAIFAPSELPSLPLVIFMFLYADAYSAVLHATLDREAALDLPFLGSTAEGFQMHHDHPVASTGGVGLYRLFCDTVKIQWTTGFCALLFAGHTALAARIIILKWVMCAYGTQLGHYWSHMPVRKKPAVVQLLQKFHLLLPSDHHVQGHHAPPYDKNFGIVSGLSNPILNPILKDLPWKVLFPLWSFMTLFDTALIERLFSTGILAHFG